MSGFWILVAVGAFFLLGLTLLTISLFTEEDLSERSRSIMNSRSTNEISDPDQLVRIAEKHEDNRNWEDAFNTWSRFLQVEPDRIEAYVRRGQTAFRDKRYRRALQDFNNAIEKSDDPPKKAYLFKARALSRMGDEKEAINTYQEFASLAPDDVESLREAAEFALKNEFYEEAKKLNNRILEADKPDANQDALLDLTDISLLEGETDRAKFYLNELEEYDSKDLLTDDQRLQHLYVKAEWCKQSGRSEEANEIYRTIYQENPNFRDVQDRIEEQITNMSRSELKQKIADMDKNDFLSFCRRIVEGMGYEVTREECLNPEEVEIRAIESGFFLSETKILFGFKRWEKSIGELPVKDFELKMIEERYQQGILINLGGFNSTSKNYARGNNKLELVGPEKLLSNMKEWYIVETTDNDTQDS